MTRRRSTGKNAASRSGQVQSLQRALRILKALAESHEGLGLREIAEIVGLPPSTVHRLLTTLESDRFVRFDANDAVWQVGVQAFVVGSAFARNRDLLRLARPYMRGLVDACGETANLYIEESGWAVCIGQVESRHFVRAIARPGGRVRMHCSAAGKVLLATKSERELAQILRSHGLERLTEHSIDRPQLLRSHLAEVRRRGYALDDEETALGVRCVAAPVHDESGSVVAALSVSGPKSRLEDARLAEVAAAVRRTAGAITTAYGGREPDPAMQNTSMEDGQTDLARNSVS